MRLNKIVSEQTYQVKLAQRRPFRDCRKTSTYKEDSSSEEEDLDFNSVDSSFNKSVEDESIEAEKNKYRVKSLVAEVTNKLHKLKHSASEEEIVNEGFIAGESGGDNLQEPIANMPNAVNFEDENGVDDPQALQNACRSLERFIWDANNLKFTFQKLEIKMSAVGVKKQYTKFQVLSTVIPKVVEDEVQALLTSQEAEFDNNDAYKQLKTEILRIFGPRPEEAIERALSRVLVGKPSQLARALVNDLSKCKPNLSCLCCPDIILAIWKRQLPGNVRAGIAHCSFNKDTFDAVVKLADDIFSANAPPSSSVAAAAYSVAAIGSGSQKGGIAAPPVNLDETQPGLPYPVVQEVNAIRGNRGGFRGGRGNRGGRGYRGGGRGGGQSQQQQSSGASATTSSRHRGTKHPDLPAGEWQGCSMHYKFGKQSYFCAEPATCPWKNVFIPRPNK